MHTFSQHTPLLFTRTKPEQHATELNSDIVSSIFCHIEMGTTLKIPSLTHWDSRRNAKEKTAGNGIMHWIGQKRRIWGNCPVQRQWNLYKIQVGLQINEREKGTKVYNKGNKQKSIDNGVLREESNCPKKNQRRFNTKGNCIPLFFLG